MTKEDLAYTTNFLAAQIVVHWNKQPADLPSLENLKKKLDKCLPVTADACLSSKMD